MALQRFENKTIVEDKIKEEAQKKSLIDLENIIHMKLLRAFVFLFFAGMISGNAQSVVHSSLYEMNPLFVNPAKTGDFLGTVRIGGLHREQWGFSNISTSFVFFDSPIMNGFRKKKDDWIGMGAYLFNDASGVADIPRLGYYLSAAYHLDLGDKKTRRVFTIGVQWGQENLGNGFDISSLNFADGHNQLTNDFGNSKEQIVGPTGQQKNAVNAGFLYKSNKKNSKESFEVGVSITNMNSLSQFGYVRFGLGDTPQNDPNMPNPNPQSELGIANKIPAYFSGHLFLKRELIKDELYFEPTVWVRVSNTWSQYNVHGWLAMNLKDKESDKIKDQVLKFGLGYRSGLMSGIHTPKALLGYETSKLKVAFAFDYYIADVIDNNYAFELAANYIISSPPKVELPSKIYCPQL